MKTISLDYQLYKKELQDAQARGAESVFDLADKLENIINLLNKSYDSKSFYEAKHELAKLYVSAKGLDNEER